MQKLSVVRGNGSRKEVLLEGVDLEQTIGEFLTRMGDEDFFLNEQSLKSLSPNRKLSELAYFHGPKEITTCSRKRSRVEEEEEEEIIPVSNPPLFYQNSFVELLAPDEEFCSKNLWEFVECADRLEEVYLLDFIISADTVKQIFPAAMLRVPIAVVVSDKHESTRRLQQCFEQVFPNELSRLIHPRIPNRFGSFHSKLMILFYPTGIRVVVHTSNIEMSNLRWHAEGSWSQDFPLKSPNQSTTSEFEFELGRALTSSGIPEAKQTLSRYDFSIAEVALVLSVPSAAGYSSKNEIQANGLGRVKFLLEQEYAREPEWRQRIASWPVVAQSSSLGSMNSALGPCWLINELGEALGCQNANEQMRLVVISQHFAHQVNVFGEDALNATRHMKSNFTNPLVRQALCPWTPSNVLLPTRASVVPHIKTYTCSKRGEEIAWLILGSHNCTQAAWGSYTKNYAKLRCISHEVSVMFLPSYMKRAGTKRWDAPRGKWFQVSPHRYRFSSTNKQLGFLPVPFALPITRYDFKVDEPFYHDDDE